MSYKTRKLWFRICAFLVALVMVSGDLAVSAAAVENENGTQIEVSSEDVDNSVEVDASETEGASDETSDEILGEENPNGETDVISEADNYDEKDSEGDSEEDAEAEEDISGETSEEEKVSDSGEAELQSVIKVKDDSTTDAHGFRDVRIDFNKETACIIYGQYLTTDSNEVGGKLSFRIDEYTENTQGAECKYSTSLKGNVTLPVPDQYQSVNGLGYVLNPSHDGNVRNIPLAKDTKYVKIVAYKIADESVVGETDFIKRDDFPAPSSKLETVGLTDNSATIEFAIQSLYTNSLQGDFTIRYGMKGDENNWNEYSDTPEELYYQNSKEKVYTWEFANLTEGTEYGYTVEADISINVNSVDKPIYSVENSGSFKTKNNSSFVFDEAFPDEAFRKVVVEKVKSLTGKADPSETEIKENLYRITDIYYNEDLTYGKIQSLKGIEYLTGLRYINVDNNDISEFPDMRNNVGLRNGVLSILYNKLSDEEVSSIRDKLPAHCVFLSENWIAETRATQNKVKPGGGDVELEYAPVYYNDGYSAKFFVLFNREFGRVEAFVDDTCFTMQNSVYVGGMSLSFEEKSKGKRLYVGDLSGNISGTKTVTIKAYEYDYESEPEFTKDISVKFDSNLAFVDGSTIQRADAGKNERFYVGTGYRYYSSSNITVAVPNEKTILSAELYLCDEEGNITEKIGENTNAPNYRGQGWFSGNLYSKYGIESMSLNMSSWNMDFAVDRLYVSKNCKIKLIYSDGTSAITENCVEFTGEEAGTVLSSVYISWKKDSSEGSEYFYLELGGINIYPDELEVQFSNKGKILGVDYISAQGLTLSLSEDFYELKFKKNAEDWQGIGYDSQITCTIKKNGQLLAHKSVTLLYMSSVNDMPLCIYNPQQQELQINLSKDIKAENNRAYVTVTRINQYSGGNTVGYGEKLIDQYVTVNADNSINVALLKTKLAGSSPYFEVEVRVAGRTMIDSFTYYSSGSSYYGGGTSAPGWAYMKSLSEDETIASAGFYYMKQLEKNQSFKVEIRDESNTALADAQIETKYLGLEKQFNAYGFSMICTNPEIFESGKKYKWHFELLKKENENEETIYTSESGWFYRVNYSEFGSMYLRDELAGNCPTGYFEDGRKAAVFDFGYFYGLESGDELRIEVFDGDTKTDLGDDFYLDIIERGDGLSSLHLVLNNLDIISLKNKYTLSLYKVIPEESDEPMKWIDGTDATGQNGIPIRIMDNENGGRISYTTDSKVYGFQISLRFTEDCYIVVYDTVTGEMVKKLDYHGVTFEYFAESNMQGLVKNKLYDFALFSSDGRLVDAVRGYCPGTIGTSVKSVVVPKTIVMAPDDPENPLTPDDPAYGNVWVDPTVTYTPANANAGIGYYMESSAPDVVEVCGNGTLHALKCGKATITVITNNGVKATIQVIVMDLNVGRSGISINTKDNPDYKRTQQLVLSDGTTNYKPEWTSSNPSVAVVDANGLLTILADNTEDGYAEISATYNGTVFSRWINVVRPVESITATAHKEYLEVWPDGEENLGYFNDTDYISVTSEPAGLINIGDNEYCNTEFNIITECGERYLEIDAYGNVRAKYDPDLGEGKEITVEVTTTTKKWNSDPPTETNRASSEVTYKIVPTDYKRVNHSDGDNVRVRLLSGISGKLGDIELPGALKVDWEWMYPDTDISKYSGMDGAQFAVKHVNKYTHEIHQDFVDVDFVDGPDFWVSWGMEGNLPYFKDDRSQGDNAVAPIVYEYWTDGRFEEMYPGYTVDVQAEPNDVLEKDGELYSSWGDLDNARMEGLKINGFRAKKAGNGEVKVTFTVKDAESRVVYTTSKTLKIKTVDATKKGVAWYDGWIIRMRDPEKAVDDYDNWDWGEDKVDPSDESSEALRYIRWDENGNVILEEGQKYLFVTASDGYAVKMKSLDTNVVSLGKAVTHKKEWDEGQRDVAIMPIVMGNPGVTTLSVTVSDAINSTMNINVRIKNDKVTLGATKFTLNRAYKDEHQYEEVTVKRGFDDAMCGAYIDDETHGVNFVPGEDGVDIVKISYPEQFDANGKKIKLAAKHKLYLVYDNSEDPDTLRRAEFDITLSESNKAPKATIKQIQNLNTSFKQVEGYDMYDTAGVFSVGIDGEVIDDVDLTFTDKTGDVELTEGNEYIFRGEDGLVYLYADPGKKKIKVTLKSEKYKDVVSTVSAKTEKKTYALSSSTGTVFTDTGIDGSYNPFDVRLVLQVNDSKTKMPVELYDLNGEVEELKVSVEASVTKGNTGNKYIPHVSDDGKHIILEADFENDVPAKTGDVLTIKVKRPEWTAAAEFKYTIKGESISKTSLVLGAKTITVYNYDGVENCSEKTTLSLKGGAAHDMLGEIKIYENIKKGQEYSIGKKFNAYIDPYLGTINVQKVSDDFEGTYNLKLELSGPWKKPISTTLTVKAVKVNPAIADSKKGIKCTTSSKGSIDVLNRQTTGVVITPKFTNIPKDARIEVIGCTGPDAHLFDDYGRNNGTVGLRLRSGVRVLTNFEYKVNIKYSISTDNGTYVEVTSPEVKIKFTQSSAKGVLVGNPTFGNAPVEYHSYVLCVANSSGNNMRIRRVDMDETAGFKLYYSDGNSDSPQGTDLEDGIVVIRHDFDGTTTTGKTYTLKLLVYPDDAASNSKPVTVTYKVTLAK